ncbi:hypothetical protein FRB94_010442 [Tulasnella sp. JGI-2019a]|nr:hypothetical protein FRB93_013872 [Tulasnella sp. JGI-2019a]KAG9010479.1 hypothetical protein FRB94_010442 [Tulasnella sp. JGI-2019a]KAG9039887.1 hypothetical protein FRB95_004359 [Tulasnella sp. JGI-2019a]
MYDDTLEQLVLSGALFNGGDRELGSPVRSRSPSHSRPSSPRTTADTVTFAPPDDEYESNTTFVGDSAHHRTPEEAPQESIGMGPGRTGVKGVIKDRNEAMERSKDKTREEKEELNARMKKMDLSARTYFEDQEAEDATKGESSKQRDGDAWQDIEGWRRRRLEELRTGSGTSGGPGNFGHLREVGAGGFVEAVDKVPRNVWVVLHIYDASLTRCAVLDSYLAVLARRHPSVKFLRSRAAAIGFAMKSATGVGSSGSKRVLPIGATRRTKYVDPDEDSSDEEGPSNFVGAHAEETHEDDVEDEAEPDYDMLPTMLVYRGGKLEFSWPRVDLDIGNKSGKGGVGGSTFEQNDVEALLTQYHILETPLSNGGHGSSDEEDLETLEFASGVE